jgi:hypothetical protein
MGICAIPTPIFLQKVQVETLSQKFTYVSFYAIVCGNLVSAVLNGNSQILHILSNTGYSHPL